MDALRVGKLDVSDRTTLDQQALALATLSMSLGEHGSRFTGVLDEIAKLPPTELLLVNPYAMKTPQAVIYKQIGSDSDLAQTASAMASAYGKLSGENLSVQSFSGDMTRLKHDSIVIVDPDFRPLFGHPTFEFSDLSRRIEMAARPGGGDQLSGLAVIGRLSKNLLDLMQNVWRRLRIAV